MSKYYFYDTGIRSAVINNFNDLNTRNDVGQLWENFLVIERLKNQAYTPIYSNNYFWRTWDKKEIDWVEMRDGQLFGYEIKLKNKTSLASKSLWLKSYSEGKYQIVDSENYLDFVS